MIKSIARIKRIIVLCVVLTTISYGQVIRGYGFKLGAVAANQTWQYTNWSVPPKDYRWGFAASAYLELFDCVNFSALIEAQYSQKGFSETLPITTESQPDGTGEFITMAPRADYLSLPLLAKVQLPLSDWTPYLLAGPRLDILLSTKADEYSVIFDKLKTPEFGATVGVGVEFTSILPMAVLTEIRYNPSFVDAYSSNFLTVRNRSLDFLLGVRL